MQLTFILSILFSSSIIYADTVRKHGISVDLLDCYIAATSLNDCRPTNVVE